MSFKVGSNDSRPRIDEGQVFRAQRQASYATNVNQIVSDATNDATRIWRRRMNNVESPEIELQIDQRKLLHFMSKAKDSLFVAFQELDVLLPLTAMRREQMEKAMNTILNGFSEDVQSNISPSLLNESSFTTYKGISIDTSVLEEIQLLQQKVKALEHNEETIMIKRREAEDALRKNIADIDYFKAQLERRDRQLKRQREKSFKDIMMLREQLFQHSNSSEDASPFAMMWTMEDPSDDKEDQKDSRTETMEKMQEIMQKYQTQIKDLKEQHRNETRIAQLRAENEKDRLLRQLADQKTAFEDAVRSSELLKNKLKSLSGQLEDAESQMHEMQKEAETFQTQIEELEEQNTHLTEQISGKMQQILSLQTEMAILKENAGFIEYQGDRLSLDEVKERLDAAAREKAQFLTKIGTLETRIIRLEMIVLDFQGLIERKNDQIKRLNTSLDENKKLITELQAKAKLLEQVQDEKQQLENAVIELTQTVEDHKRKYDYMKTTLTEKIGILEKKLAEALDIKNNPEYKALENRANHLQKENNRMSDDLTEKEKRITELMRIIAQLQQQIKEGKFDMDTPKVPKEPSAVERLFPSKEEIIRMNVLARLLVRGEISEFKRKELRDKIYAERAGYLLKVFGFQAGHILSDEQIEELKQVEMEEHEKREKEKEEKQQQQQQRTTVIQTPRLGLMMPSMESPRTPSSPRQFSPPIFKRESSITTTEEQPQQQEPPTPSIRKPSTAPSSSKKQLDIFYESNRSTANSPQRSPAPSPPRNSTIVPPESPTSTTSYANIVFPKNQDRPPISIQMHFRRSSSPKSGPKANNTIHNTSQEQQETSSTQYPHPQEYNESNSLSRSISTNAVLQNTENTIQGPLVPQLNLHQSKLLMTSHITPQSTHRGQLITPQPPHSAGEVSIDSVKRNYKRPSTTSGAATERPLTRLSLQGIQPARPSSKTSRNSMPNHMKSPFYGIVQYDDSYNRPPKEESFEMSDENSKVREARHVTVRMNPKYGTPR